jgi:hypothetical protein
MNLGYRYSLDGACSEFLWELPRRRRERLLAFFRRLADNPFLAGDYRAPAANRASLEVMLVEEDILVTWHVDHAVKEVQVIGLEWV